MHQVKSKETKKKPTTKAQEKDAAKAKEVA
jgi:hypothetical protein